MIWKSKFYLRDKEGEVRIRKRFLFFPLTFDRKKTRWLCFANVVERVERVERVDVGGSMEWGNYAWKWVPVDFADELHK